MTKLKGGGELIAAERRRQTEELGWTPEHDAQHTQGELAEAACYYAWSDNLFAPSLFPGYSWDKTWMKRDSKSRLRQLVVAGALIAAEIDRIQGHQLRQDDIDGAFPRVDERQRKALRKFVAEPINRKG